MALPSERVGFHQDFFEPYRVTHFAVESDVGSVTSALAGLGHHMKLSEGESVLARVDLLGQAHEDARDIAMVFQLRGLSWSQVFADIRAVDGLPLSKELSDRLQCRVLCLELTDDAYNARGLFHRGEVVQLSIDATNHDIKRLLGRLEMGLPDNYRDLDLDADDEIEEDSYGYFADPEQEEEELVRTVERLGIYWHCIYLTDGATYGLEDVEPDDVIRLDMVIARKESADS